MAVKLNYQSLRSGDKNKQWDGPDSPVSCCLIDPPGETGCIDGCYDDWREKVKKVNQEYGQAMEEAAQLQKKITTLTDSRNRYKAWIDEFEAAEEYAVAICNQLQVIAGQSHRIWYSACKTEEAIKKLFCMIRDFYNQVDGLKNRYDEIEKCILKNTDPSLSDKDKGIRGCLGQYYAKLDIIIKTRETIIKDIVTAIQISSVLRNNIYTKECNGDFDPCIQCNCSNDGNPPENGLRSTICDLYCYFCENCNEKPNPASPPPDLCTSESALNAYAEMPKCRDTDYRNCIKTWYEAEKKCVDSLNTRLKEVNQKKESAQACKLSLDKAISEVNPKNRCI